MRQRTMGAHRRIMANTTEQSVCGSDATFCQFSLTTCMAAQ